MPGEERKLATVLFADLVGSTELAGAQDPERIRAVARPLLRRDGGRDRARRRDGREVRRRRRDGRVRRARGARGPRRAGAPRGARDAAAAGELFGDRLALADRRQHRRRRGRPPREGSSFVTGDAVNVGARLEQAAAPGEMLVGERTVRGRTRRVRVRRAGRRSRQRASREGVACSPARPRAVADAAARGGRAATGPSSDVRRSCEQLHVASRAVVDRPRAAAGDDPGRCRGRQDRLLRELWEWLAAATRCAAARTGRCLSYGQGITYWPLGGGAEGALRDPRERFVREVVTRTPRSAAASWVSPSGSPCEDCTRWPRASGSTTRGSSSSKGSSSSGRSCCSSRISTGRRTTCAICWRRWSDRSGPLLLIATARPELLDRRPAGAGTQRTSQLVLEALPPADAGQLLDELLGSRTSRSAAPRDRRARRGQPVLRRGAGGDADRLGMCCERGTVAGRSGSCPRTSTCPTRSSAVSPRVSTSARRREKQALQAASVIGRVFWAGPVYELVEAAGPTSACSRSETSCGVGRALDRRRA